MDWFQQVLRKCSQIVPQKIELSGTGQGMATLAAWPASTPWALGHDSAKVVFQRCFFKRLDVFSWLLWIEMRKNYAARLKNLWKLQLSGELLWKLSSGSCFATVEQLCRYSAVSRSTFWNFWIPGTEGWRDVNPLEYWLCGLKFGIKKEQYNTVQQKRGKAMMSIKIKITCSFISYI